MYRRKGCKPRLVVRVLEDGCVSISRAAWGGFCMLMLLFAFVAADPPAYAGVTLPDQRADELVSTEPVGEPYLPPTPFEKGHANPGEKGSGASETRSALPFRASSDGEAMLYVGEPGASGGTGATGPGEGNQWLARRELSGWEAADITPSEISQASEALYESFSSKLSTGIFEGDAQPLTSGVQPGCAALYTRDSASGEFFPVFTGGQGGSDCGHPFYAGASADESTIIFQSEAALTVNSVEASEVPAGHEGLHSTAFMRGKGCLFGCNLYAATDGQLRLVNEVEGEVIANATFGGYAGGERKLTNFSNAISADGSRIFWTDTREGPRMEHVYVRENGTSTVSVSGSEPAEYWTASTDGRYAFYTEGGELWRFDTDTAKHEQLAPEGAGVLGVIGTNDTGEDGRYLYFVAEGALTGEEANAHGESAVPGEPNLYVREQGISEQGATRFIATLSPEDNEILAFSEGQFEKSSDWRANLGERLSEVTPDGQHLVFESVNALTGYDNVIEGNPQPEVFAYSATENQLVCASCNPTGAPPSVRNYGFPQSKLPESAEAATYQRRWISENGNRVFFDSEEPLVPQDTNGLQDVYEWEREGEGTCARKSPSSPTGGCVFLLSEGSSTLDSFLVDADASGENAFFEHVGPVGHLEVPADHLELIDARVRGGFPTPSHGCAGVGCEEEPQRPSVPVVPTTVAFEGLRNFPPPAPTGTRPKALTQKQKLNKALLACKKDKKKARRASCEKQAHRKYGVVRAKKASNSRRAHS